MSFSYSLFFLTNLMMVDFFWKILWQDDFFFMVSKTPLFWIILLKRFFLSNCWWFRLKFLFIILHSSHPGIVLKPFFSEQILIRKFVDKKNPYCCGYSDLKILIHPFQQEGGWKSSIFFYFIMNGFLWIDGLSSRLIFLFKNIPISTHCCWNSLVGFELYNNCIWFVV